uniref:Centrobin, centriole duplication and spindle assembly protein n=1 Tax=Terrapene triunguis TaxID=2587831 RepID=A0A674JCX8_9SAUR
MAEKGPCPGLDASLRSEDLLSDMEPLPLSAPATPAQPFGSEVTAQLYASLRRSRQAELDACSQLQPPDLDALAEELNRTLSVGVEASARRKGGESRHVAEMETVRSRLRTMLQDSRELPSERRGDGSVESDSTTALLAARPLQELSPPGSVCGLEELFPRYASLRLGTPPEPAPSTEPQLLKEALAKERARRKHCERHVQGLQSRALELQQQLAAAISADMKKDSMIEQLDKTLAKVVEGWNRQEAERTELLRGLQAEKEAVQRALSEQQELEVRLEQAQEALSQEQQAASQQREEAQEEKAGLLRSLEAERQRGRGLQVEREHGQRQLEVLRATLEEQQAGWAQRERQLEQRCQALQDESAGQLEREKAAVQWEAQRAADAQQVLASVQANAQRLESELEAARSERDGLQMEISLVKARCEAQKAKLEAELKVALEQQVTERLARVHEDSLRQTAQLPAGGAGPRALPAPGAQRVRLR